MYWVLHEGRRFSGAMTKDAALRYTSRPRRPFRTLTITGQQTTSELNACAVCSNQRSKPSAYMQNMLVTFQVDPSLIYGGSNEPAALVDLRYAAGDFGKDIHARLTKIISDILSDKLGVPSNRCHIVFHEKQHGDWGAHGKLLTELGAN